MSDYHILQQALDKKTINVVFHLPIPGTGVNNAGVQWRDAIVLDAGGSDNINSILPGIDPIELAAMKSGALIEKYESLRFSILDLTPVQKKAEIEARFIALKDSDPAISVVLQKQITLEWIGYENDVPQ